MGSERETRYPPYTSYMPWCDRWYADLTGRLAPLPDEMLVGFNGLGGRLVTMLRDSSADFIQPIYSPKGKRFDAAKVLRLRDRCPNVG
jgi:hypothetical protein